MINNITWLNVRLPEEINFWIGTRYPNSEEKPREAREFLFTNLFVASPLHIKPQML